MKHPLIYLAVSFLLVTSCKPLDKIGRVANEPLTDLNITKLEGKYKSFNGGYPSLWEIAAPYKSIRRTGESRNKIELDKLYVNVRSVSSRKLIFQLFDERGMVRSKVIKGKIRDGYFYGRQKIGIVPLPPIIFSYDFFRYRIGVDGDYLIADERRNHFWNFFLIHGGLDDYKVTQKFLRE